MCLCSCTPCEGIHAQVTSQGGGAQGGGTLSWLGHGWGLGGQSWLGHGCSGRTDGVWVDAIMVGAWDVIMFGTWMLWQNGDGWDVDALAERMGSGCT